MSLVLQELEISYYSYDRIGWAYGIDEKIEGLSSELICSCMDELFSSDPDFAEYKGYLVLECPNANAIEFEYITIKYVEYPAFPIYVKLDGVLVKDITIYSDGTVLEGAIALR